MKNSIPKQYQMDLFTHLSLLPSYLSPCLTFHNTLGQLPSPFLNPEPQVQMMEVGGTAANPKAKK